MYPYRYIIEDALGQGTFGQVVRCLCPETQSKAAVKVIKNQDAYFQQARVEIGILKLLGDNYSDRHNIVRLQEYFVFREHLCLVFELLDANLYDLLKRNRYRGLSIQLVWCFVKQVGVKFPFLCNTVNLESLPSLVKNVDFVWQWIVAHSAFGVAKNALVKLAVEWPTAHKLFPFIDKEILTSDVLHILRVKHF